MPATIQHQDLPTQVFEDLDFTLMEMNPFTLDASGQPFPLDMRGELDDTAAFKSGKKWGDLEFPLPFGRTMTAAEEYVAGLDGKTGASLKLSILNPKGRIWTMVAGGRGQEACLHLSLAPDVLPSHEVVQTGGLRSLQGQTLVYVLLGCMLPIN